jgi:RecA-family ATPase
VSASAPAPPELPVARAADLEVASAEHQWLVRQIWTQQAVGIVGGVPKSCKSWLGLDLAVSVASSTPCLGRFAVDDPGTALVYLAEDALPLVRGRIADLCLHRGLALAALDLLVITAPSLRLDLPADQARLRATLARHKPRLLVLDPLVRLHRLDENLRHPLK